MAEKDNQKPREKETKTPVATTLPVENQGAAPLLTVISGTGGIGFPMEGSASGGTSRSASGRLIFSSGSSVGPLPSAEQFELHAKLQKKEEELLRVKQEYIQELRKKDSDHQQLQAKHQEIEKRNQLHNILSGVEEAAQTKLLTDESFAEEFSKENCFAYVMSVDIRKSTDLMLKAIKPREFAVFINTLCDQLRGVVLSNHGIFDKFTGDGILAFFPDFYSGKDAGFLAVKSASECHDVFKTTYNAHLDCFTTARSDAGLGIGIDCGQVDLVTNLGGLTVVGTPVVYACRLGSAPAGTTQLNQQAYRWIFKNYSAYCSFAPTTVGVKNEGDFLAYQVILNGKPYTPKQPSWLPSAGGGVAGGTAKE